VSKSFKRGKSNWMTSRGRRLVGFERLESRELLSASGGVEVDDPADVPAAVVDSNSRQMEALNRGVIAMRRATNEIYIGWRMLGTDPSSVSFNLYRSANGGGAVMLNGSPITQSTNFLDTTANTSVSNTYFVRPIIAGIELAASESFTLQASAPTRQYLNVPLQRPAGRTIQLPPGVTGDPGSHDYTYNANDASVGDLDGDGQYEIIVKWDPFNPNDIDDPDNTPPRTGEGSSQDNSRSGFTGNTLVDAYKLDGTLMWRVDLGRNVRAGAHYLPFTVYDFDGDGKAEVIMRTAEATIDGTGTVVGNANADYRNSSGYILTGPEYLSVFNGETGAIMDSAPMFPQRGSVSSWGDSYGNRVDRFQQTVAYLDPDRPSLVIGRGYAGPQGGFNARNEVAAFDYRDGELSFRWLFAAATNGANPGYVGQSAHSIVAADVDGDGRDEIITGAAGVDDDGTLLHLTGLGHGDALHVTDMDPSRPGLEIYMPHEGTSGNGHIGASLRDADTGALLFGPTVVQNAQGQWPDVGRGVAADIDPNNPGYELWNSYHPSIYSTQGVALYAKPGNMHNNHLVWWDADLLRETLDGTTVGDWNYTTAGRVNLMSSGNSGINSTSGLSSNNGSKSNPALTGDLLGDWREEIIWRTSDNLNLRIYSTTILATNRLTTLMHDSQYREAVAWQNSGYNQPAHPSFFLGAGMTTPPQPNIYTVSANPTIPGDFDLDGNVNDVDLGIWQQTYGMTQAQGYLPGDANGDGKVNGRDYMIWQRNYGLSQGGLAATTATSSAMAAEEEFAQSTRDEAISQLAGVSLSAILKVEEPSDATASSELDLYFETPEAGLPPAASATAGVPSSTPAADDDPSVEKSSDLDFSLEVLESIWS
jgi:rhamnogalacturonan endolyase